MSYEVRISNTSVAGSDLVASSARVFDDAKWPHHLVSPFPGLERTEGIVLSPDSADDKQLADRIGSETGLLVRVAGTDDATCWLNHRVRKPHARDTPAATVASSLQ